MTTKVLLPILLFSPFCLVEADPVDYNDAQKVACNFMKRSFGKTDAVADVVPFDTLGFTAMYAFNFSDGGYVLTSGSKKSDPILAYSETGRFLPEDSIDNENLLDFLTKCKHEVIYREENPLKSLSTESLQKWDTWMTDEYYPPSYGPGDYVNEVPDLLYDPNVGAAVEWKQKKCEGEVTNGHTGTNNNPLGISYNIMMPSAEGCEHAVAGCVPTALAQVLWKWKWPNSVTYTYKDELYESKYTWDSMPPILDVNSSVRNMNEVSTLLRDCGYMLDVAYGCGGFFKGTSAYNEHIYSKLVKTGLIGYNAYGNIFTNEYSRRLGRNASDAYPMTEWVNLVITELIAGRPIILGSRSHSHCYIISGFQKRDDGYYFYVNYGWGIDLNGKNGYYNLDFTTKSIVSDTMQTAIIGFSPQKGNENHEHDIHATCTRSTIGKAGKLSFYVENANSYILKIKYMEKTVRGWTSVRGVITECDYREGLKENILDRTFGNIFEDGVVDVWYSENVKLENEYTTECDVLSAPTMYNITFMNNYGQVVTYEGTFESEESVPTSVGDELTQDVVLVYPNPSTGIFSIHSPQNNINKITVHNVFGTSVKEVETKEKTRINLDLSDCPTGCYYVAINTDNSRVVKPIIKK